MSGYISDCFSNICSICWVKSITHEYCAISNVHLRRLAQKRDEILSRLEDAEARHDLTMVADLRYGALPEIEAALEREQPSASDNSILTEEVYCISLISSFAFYQ